MGNNNKQQVIKGMKNKKVGDNNNWKSEWIKEGGIEMMWSLATLFNRVEEEKIIPAQGTETKIKSVYK